MWMNIERGIDGVVGRMLSWLTQPPVRGVDSEPPAVPASAPVEEAASATAGEPESSAGAIVEVADAAAGSTATAAEIVETAPRPDASSEEEDELEGAILEALAAAPDGLAMRDLVRETAAKRHALRRRLSRLSGAGRVQRRGEGMTTRYHRLVQPDDRPAEADTKKG